ncbi:zinc ribbon domain-containing protein [Chondromyces crocatus]|uniref:TFIIE beta domain-containing protein n=1 Tax=Chondromyces crocatus TaxID=52 RepID=A0A0K1ERH1_CHOCO|nr:zinc ribbon domain-containing protein [Chondromyces crocatus]AKT43441.1 uncharacterized protein CMC5_076730 [Chondromyces crocatus]
MNNPNIAANPHCSACGADVALQAERCPRCGTSQRQDVCPHCAATSGVTRDTELRFRCDVCGGPRVPPSPGGLPRSGREATALQRAQTAVSGRSLWRIASVVGGLMLGFAFLVLTLFLLISGASTGLFVAGALTIVPLVMFMLWAMARARARGREIAPSLDAAWLAAATDVAAQSQQALTSRELSAALSIGDAQAEELLALLEVNDVVRGTVTQDGNMVYSQRLRVGPAPATANQTTAGAEPSALAAAAEEEALALEEATLGTRGLEIDVDTAKK